MSPRKRKARGLSRCFPRVSGDEPLVMIDEAWAFEFSPRERG